MRCSLQGLHLRVFSRAVRLMAKYSDYMTILARPNEMILQSLNDSKSAFCEVIFEKDYFLSYDCSTNVDCKVDIKSINLVFRIINLDKIVDVCKILLEWTCPRIVFEMKCKYSIYREYSIPFMESDVNKCSRISQKLPAPSIKASAKVFAEIFKYFSNSTKETVVWMFQNHASFKTFIDTDDQNFYDLPSTSFSLSASEFTLYNFTQETLSTFNLRDIKAFLDFAVFQDPLVFAYFQSEGDPIEFMFNSNTKLYSARIIMATIEFNESERPQPPLFVQRNLNVSDRVSTRNNSISTNSESIDYTISNSFQQEDFDSSIQDVVEIENKTQTSQRSNVSENVPEERAKPDSNQQSGASNINENETGDSKSEANNATDNLLSSSSQNNVFSNEEEENIDIFENENIVQILEELPQFCDSQEPIEGDLESRILLFGSQLDTFQEFFIPTQSTPCPQREILFPDSDSE